jgi:hypothetical protein
MSDFIDLMREHGLVKSFRAMPSGKINAQELECPPLIIWEYQPNDPDFETLLESVINNYGGEIEWVCYKENSKLILSPKVLEEYRREHELGHKPALGYFMENMPDFGVSANEDLSRLVNYLRETLR